MRDADLPVLSEMLDAVCSMLSRGQYTPTPENTAMWFRALQRYDISQVRVGLDAHVRDPKRGRFVPTPADVIAQILVASPDGRPEPDEAWAIAVRAEDETSTLVWFDELAQAWAIAQPLFYRDKVGARLAFLDAYERLVADARAAGRPVNWTASLGTDATRRDISPADADRLPALPAPQREALAAPRPSTHDALQPLRRSRQMPDHVRAQLETIRGSIVRAPGDLGPYVPSADADGKARTAQLRDDMQRRVDEYMGAPAHGA